MSTIEVSATNDAGASSSLAAITRAFLTPVAATSLASLTDTTISTSEDASVSVPSFTVPSLSAPHRQSLPSLLAVVALEKEQRRLHRPRFPQSCQVKHRPQQKLRPRPVQQRGRKLLEAMPPERMPQGQLESGWRCCALFSRCSTLLRCETPLREVTSHNRAVDCCFKLQGKAMQPRLLCVRNRAVSSPCSILGAATYNLRILRLPKMICKPSFRSLIGSRWPRADNCQTEYEKPFRAKETWALKFTEPSSRAAFAQKLYQTRGMEGRRHFSASII